MTNQQKHMLQAVLNNLHYDEAVIVGGIVGNLNMKLKDLKLRHSRYRKEIKALKKIIKANYTISIDKLQ